ncbi:MAG: TetR family transcriptional regulator [bacterium]|nr:TetR family transcriptional regulator [bacterium]
MSPPQARPNRIAEIVAAAAVTFARFGFRRTQMADIAAAAGTALGTLYRYSKSKEALFAAALRYAFHADPMVIETVLAGATPGRDDLEAYVADFGSGRDFLPQLTAAAEAGVVDRKDAAAELERVVGELFDVMNHFALAICLVDVSAREWPELARLFHRDVRATTAARLERYLSSRCESGALVQPPDVAAAAHFVMELCGEFTRGRKISSPNRGFASDEVARATVLHIVQRTFVDPS